MNYDMLPFFVMMAMGIAFIYWGTQMKTNKKDKQKNPT